MRIDYVNNAIMEVLLAGAVTMKHTKLENVGHIFSDTGIVAYVLQEDQIFFAMDKCVRSDALANALKEKAPAIHQGYLLTKTLDAMVGKGGTLLTRLKASNWDTFVDMDLLEAFDHPNFYQAEKIGIITVTEGTAGTALEFVRGFVMPARTGLETDGHYNDKTREAQP